jgi:hypothetical protein
VPDAPFTATIVSWVVADIAPHRKCLSLTPVGRWRLVRHPALAPARPSRLAVKGKGSKVLGQAQRPRGWPRSFGPLDGEVRPCEAQGVRRNSRRVAGSAEILPRAGSEAQVRRSMRGALRSWPRLDCTASDAICAYASKIIKTSNSPVISSRLIKFPN